MTNDHENHTVAGTAASSPAVAEAPDHVTQLAEAVETVKALLAAGLLDPAVLGASRHAMTTQPRPAAKAATKAGKKKDTSKKAAARKKARGSPPPTTCSALSRESPSPSVTWSRRPRRG